MTSDEQALSEVRMVPVNCPTGPNPEGLPWVTHSGALPLPDGTSLRCYQLSDGRRIFDADDVHALLGLCGDS